MSFLCPLAYAEMGFSMLSTLPSVLIPMWFEFVYDPMTRGIVPWESDRKR